MNSAQGTAVVFRWSRVFFPGVHSFIHLHQSIELCSNQDFSVLTDFICISCNWNRTNRKTCKCLRVWPGWGGLKPFRNMIYFVDGGTSGSIWVPAVEWSHCTPCLFEHGIFFLGFFQFFPLAVLSHDLCSLYQYQALHLLLPSLSSVTFRDFTSWWLFQPPPPCFSLMSAMPESSSGNAPMSYPQHRSLICSYQLPTSPTQCFSLVCSLPDVVLAAHIFCSLFMVCWYQKQQDLGSGNIASLGSSACCFGEQGRGKSGPVEPGWRLLCAYGVLRELCWVSLPQRFTIWPNVIGFFFFFFFFLLH